MAMPTLPRRTLEKKADFFFKTSMGLGPPKINPKFNHSPVGCTYTRHFGAVGCRMDM